MRPYRQWPRGLVSGLARYIAGMPASRICSVSWRATASVGTSPRRRLRSPTRATHGQAFAAFMERILDSDVLAITINLAGTFTPTDDLMADSTRAEDLNTRLVERTKGEGGLRADIEVDDLSLILEQVASLRIGDERRTRQLRRRYLALYLAGLRTGGEPLPGPPPAPMELASRWSPESRR